MANDGTQSIEQDLNEALEELRTALARAHDATASLQRILPRVAQVGSLFDELASVINTGRQQFGSSEGSSVAYTRPTLVVPAGQRQGTPAPELRQADDPWASLAENWGTQNPEQGTTFKRTGASAVATASLTCFRLEFESKPGPLDLRAVDDAVGEHPAVRDVALLDYDGRKASLKVWIEKGTEPDDVRASLVARATELFGTDNEVTVTAHAEAA